MSCKFPVSTSRSFAPKSEHLQWLQKETKAVLDEQNEMKDPGGKCLLTKLRTGSDTSLKTNIGPLKIDHWKRRFLLEIIIFRGYVSFRE